MDYDMIGRAKRPPLGGLVGAGLGNLGSPRSHESQREYLALEVEQQKINLRHAELRLKQHDEWEADRKEQEAAMAKGRDPIDNNVTYARAFAQAAPITGSAE